MMFGKFSKTRSCPVCRSSDVYRVRRSGVANRIVSEFSDYRPHWCSSCDTFFYAPKQPRSSRNEGTLGKGRSREFGEKRPQAGGASH